MTARVEPRQAFWAATVPVVVWALYIGVGWAVAPAWCESPGLFHGVSAALVAIAAGALFVGWSAARNAADAASDRVTARGFTVGVGVKLGALFLGGTMLAWILAAVWCG